MTQNEMQRPSRPSLSELALVIKRTSFSHRTSHDRLSRTFCRVKMHHLPSFFLYRKAHSYAH